MKNTKKFLLTFIFVNFLSLSSLSVFAEHGKKLNINNDKGPWKHTLLYKISPNNKFNDAGKVLVKGGHVPSLVEKEKKIFSYFQWFTKEKEHKKYFDHIGFKTKLLNEKNWSQTKPVIFINVPKRVFGKRTRPMDPAAVLLPNGNIRLFLL